MKQPNTFSPIPYGQNPYGFYPQMPAYYPPEQSAQKEDRKGNFILAGVGLAIVGLGYVLYKKLSASKDQQKIAEQGNRLEVQQASALHSLLLAGNDWNPMTSVDVPKIMAIAGEIEDFSAVSKAYQALTKGGNLQDDLQSALGDNYKAFISRAANNATGQTSASDVYSPTTTNESVHVPQSKAQYVVTNRKARVFFESGDAKSSWFTSGTETYIDAGLLAGVFTGKKIKRDGWGWDNINCIEVQLYLTHLDAAKILKQHYNAFFNVYNKYGMSFSLSQKLSDKYRPLVFIIEEDAVSIYPTQTAAMSHLKEGAKALFQNNWVGIPKGMSGFNGMNEQTELIYFDTYYLDTGGNLVKNKVNLSRKSIKKVLGYHGNMIKVQSHWNKTFVLVPKKQAL